MQKRMKALVPSGEKEITVDLFGYTTKGIPGLEIVGMGKNSRQLKEKLIYLSRLQPEGLPLSRFVLCLDENTNTAQLKEDQLRWLEIPFLILFWSLAGLVPLDHLENCYSSGTIGVSGSITLRDPCLVEIPSKRSIYIGHLKQAIPPSWFHISIDDIFKNRPGFYMDNFLASSS
jgi:hypothetical protein